jgi:hypothetical protein
MKVAFDGGGDVDVDCVYGEIESSVMNGVAFDEARNDSRAPDLRNK